MRTLPLCRSLIALSLVLTGACGYGEHAADEEGAAGEQNSGAGPRTDGQIGEAAQALVAVPANKRRIPLRFVQLVDSSCSSRPQPLCGASCGNASNTASTANIQQSVDTANAVYAAAGVSFTIRSIQTVEAPYLWCTARPSVSWANARSAVQAMYPRTPTNAWSDGELKPANGDDDSSWMHAAGATYGSDDEIVVIVRPVGGAATDHPEIGHSGMFYPVGLFGNNPGSNSTNGSLHLFAHELGHYLGLRHVFDPQAGWDPVTGLPWKKSDRWDLVYAPTSGAPLFFTNAAIAAVFESSLQNIIVRNSSVNNCVQLTDSNGDKDGRIRCTVDGHDYETGDPELAFLAFDSGQVPSPPTVLRYGRNVMDYGDMTGPRGMSPSQERIVSRYLGHEATLTPEYIARVGVLPTGYSASHLRSGRSRLGLSSNYWSVSNRNYCNASGQTLFVGDFDGDGRDDLLCNSASGAMSVDRSNTKGEFWSAEWTHATRNFCVASGEKLYVGDFNGDGRDDLLCNSSNGSMFVDLANVNGEFWGSDWSLGGRNFCVASGEKLYVGDYNGDGRDDLLCNSSNGSMFVDLANVNGEFWSSDWSLGNRNFCVTSGEKLHVGDFDGDGRDDLLCNSGNGAMFVDLANVSGEFWSSNWSTQRDYCLGANEQLSVVDVNSDGRDDILCRDSVTGHFSIDLANVSGEFWSTELDADFDGWCGGSSNQFAVGDFDGDGDSDVLCNEPGGRMWVEYMAVD